jgi:MutS domain V
MTSDPAAVYQAQLDLRRRGLAREQGRDVALSWFRGGVVIAGVFAWLAGVSTLALVLAGAFCVLVIVHERQARAVQRAQRRVAFFEAALARMNGDWAGRGELGTAFADPAHPYAADLDLFGRGSLFERLCSARTRAGEETLAGWLLAPAPVEALRERQVAVAEIGPLVLLREDLAVLGAESRRAVDSTALRTWLEIPVRRVPPSLRAYSLVLSVVAYGMFAAWLQGAVDGRALTLAIFAVGALSRFAGRFTAPILSQIGRPAKDLRTLAALLDRLAAEPFRSPLLVRLQAELRAQGQSPSQHIGGLLWLVETYDSKSNLLFAPLAFMAMADVHLAAAIERWRARHAVRALGWLTSLGEMEALASLGAYAFEHPRDPFPTFEEKAPLFQATGLGHPLLPESQCVRNDVALDKARGLLVVTGSNMSGKSTLLRTVGINAVLAQAGAPVRAASLRLSPLAVGASIRIQDSLQQAQSRFYAEVSRVRQLMDLAARHPPLLFLIDEIFQGTNSADRQVGAEAVVRALVRQEAIGLITSHDLALTEIANALAPAAANVHFEDHFKDGRMAFDYRLKTGPVQKSNALALMRAVGLEV